LSYQQILDKADQIHEANPFATVGDVAQLLTQLDSKTEPIIIRAEAELLHRGLIPEFIVPVRSVGGHERKKDVRGFIVEDSVQRLTRNCSVDVSEVFQWNRMYSYCYQIAEQLPIWEYWETRYATGGTSGRGSYGYSAHWKASVVNEFVRINGIQKVADLGCGDGNQLRLFHFPSYLGIDVSSRAISMCRRRFASDTSKRFVHYDRLTRFTNECEIAMSLDVVFHLVDDESYERYMWDLFSLSDKFVIVYSTNHQTQTASEVYHVRHRCFTRWVRANKPEWLLAPALRSARGNSFAFWFFHRRGIPLILPNLNELQSLQPDDKAHGAYYEVNTSDPRAHDEHHQRQHSCG